jgi:ubiquinone/menaquinone biosynthesis C-methylase UbiE
VIRTAAGAPAGNVFDKYASRGPVVSRLVSGFRGALFELLEQADPESLIDVGCGEGVLTAEIADRLEGRRVVGVDLPDPGLAAHWGQHARPNLELRAGDAYSVPAARGELDAATALEVLEHLRDPDAALREIRRVTRRWLIASVPREPLWRAANLARGTYLRSLGNTPGHVNHWPSRRFLSMLERHGSIEAVRHPLPWTMALVRL